MQKHLQQILFKKLFNGLAISAKKQTHYLLVFLERAFGQFPSFCFSLSLVVALQPPHLHCSRFALLRQNLLLLPVPLLVLLLPNPRQPQQFFFSVTKTSSRKWCFTESSYLSDGCRRSRRFGCMLFLERCLPLANLSFVFALAIHWLIIIAVNGNGRCLFLLLFRLQMAVQT